MSLFQKKSAEQWLREEDKNLDEMIAQLSLFNSQLMELGAALKVLKKQKKESLGPNVQARIEAVMGSIERLFGHSPEIVKKAKKVEEDARHAPTSWDVNVYDYSSNLVYQGILIQAVPFILGKTELGGTLNSKYISTEYLRLFMPSPSDAVRKKELNCTVLDKKIETVISIEKFHVLPLNLRIPKNRYELVLNQIYQVYVSNQFIFSFQVVYL